MSHRHQQLTSTLRRAIQEVIGRGLADPRAGGMITVTELQLAPDLKTATAMISVYPEAKQDLTMHALEHAAGHIRRQAGELVTLAQMPRLTFRLDTSLKKQAEVVAMISKAAAEREARGAGGGGAKPEGSP